MDTPQGDPGGVDDRESVFSSGRDPLEVRERVQSVLVLAGHLLDRRFPPVHARSSVPYLRQVLADAGRAVQAALETATVAQQRDVLRALVLQIRFVAGSLDAGCLGAGADVRGVLGDVELALRRLRPLSSASELAAHAPVELGRLGFTRVLLSRIEEGFWITESAYARADASLATALVNTGQQRPRRMSAELYETQMVRRRRPILVGDPGRSPHVHTELVALTQTRAYVAAPLISGGQVVGLLHADKDGAAGRVAGLDQLLLAVFTEGLGQAYERAMCVERMRRFTQRLDGQVSVVGDMIEEFLAGETTTRTAAPSTSGEPGHRAGTPEPLSAARASGRLGLTEREWDILAAMVDGKTNAQIAQRLFVTETTVKYHVRNVLRKLGARNRADAVARLLRS